MITNISTNSLTATNKTNTVRKNPYLNQPTTSVKSDSFEISAAGHDFKAVLDAVKQAPDIREERISAIQQQVDSGSYSINAQDIANKMLSHI